MIIFIKTNDSEISLEIESSATLYYLHKKTKDILKKSGNLILDGKLVKRSKKITLEERGIKEESKLHFKEIQSLKISATFEGREETIVVPSRSDVTIRDIKQEIRNKWPDEESFFQELPRVFYRDQELNNNDIATDVLTNGAKIRVKRLKCKSNLNKNNKNNANNNNINNNNNDVEIIQIKDDNQINKTSWDPIYLKGKTFKTKSLSSAMTAAVLVIIGDEGVGKTSLIITHTTNNFPSKSIPTICEYYSAIVTFKERRVSLGITDTSLQVDYDYLLLLLIQELIFF